MTIPCWPSAPAPTLLPPAVHRLLRRQAEHARQESAIGRTTPPTAWLFPGYAAGPHLSPATLAAELRHHLPAAVLGISTTSPLQWTRRAARDRNAYLASRQPAPIDVRAGQVLSGHVSGPPADVVLSGWRSR
ncbi:hypothetical protein [Streptomyces rimosus]|uniref:hypothetical protein n=1 Tax=Streptomyces rimosus TaxID=1927 RepID=UPI000AA1413A|nr:hypothetical protein [Streptomyces rimosus]